MNEGEIKGTKAGPQMWKMLSGVWTLPRKVSCTTLSFSRGALALPFLPDHNQLPSSCLYGVRFWIFPFPEFNLGNVTGSASCGNKAPLVSSRGYNPTIV